jgi:hypothetical protein
MSVPSRTDIINFLEINLLMLLLLIKHGMLCMSNWLLVIKDVLLSRNNVLSLKLANSRDVVFSNLKLVLLEVVRSIIIEIANWASLHIVYFDLFSLVVKWIVNEVLLAFILVRKTSNNLLVNKNWWLILFKIINWRLVWLADCRLIILLLPVVLVKRRLS